MIYVFTGSSELLIREKTLGWKKLFQEKNGDFNLIHFKNLTEIDTNQLSEQLLAEGFLGEKKLIIIEDIPLGTENKSNKLQEIQEFLLQIVEKIPENNIVIFSSVNPDKRGKFYKLVSKIATKVEEFHTQKPQEVLHVLQKRYPLIESQTLQFLVQYKGGHLEKCIQELEKLSITKTHISIDDIKQHIKPELEESIFQCIDDILQKDISKALQKMQHILDDTSVYAFYNNLLANLRTTVYISKFRHLGKTPHEIIAELQLGNRSFLASKNFPLPHSSLERLYLNLIEIDSKMKSGKLLGTEEQDFVFEIEKCLLKL